jgi:hypothetical protein
MLPRPRCESRGSRGEAAESAKSRLSPSCLTSLSIPFHHLRPVRHYPHLWISARGLGLSGTSTHLTRQLSGTHYDGVRLFGLVHHRLRLLVFPMRTGGVHPPAKPETSRFPCKERPHMPGSLTTPGGMALAIARLPCCLPRYQARWLPDRRTFRGSVAGLCAPLSTLRPHLHRCRRMTRGQCSSLDLHCKRLALSTLCRFRRRTDNVLYQSSLVLSSFQAARRLAAPVTEILHLISYIAGFDIGGMSVAWPTTWAPLPLSPAGTRIRRVARLPLLVVRGSPSGCGGGLRPFTDPASPVAPPRTSLSTPTAPSAAFPPPVTGAALRGPNCKG